MRQEYSINPIEIIETDNQKISVFSTDGKNIDKGVVEAFGEEWLKFNKFSEVDIEQFGNQYFDIVDDSIINKSSYVLDLGCGSGRWAKYLAPKVGFIEAIDPSNAVFAANKLLKNVNNLRITKATVDNIPFADNTFDFAMSIGVLHHIPDTQQAMNDVVKKVKVRGHFYCYLYYNLDRRGVFFKLIFKLSTLLRLLVCKLPSVLKKFVCDCIAVLIYMPFILLTRFFYSLGLKKLGDKIPLNDYANKSFFVIRNDALDRFGTSLEQRFSKKEIIQMMTNAGLTNIVVSNGTPYYHAVGRKG